MQDFLLDENHNLTQMDSNTTECHLEVKADPALFAKKIITFMISLFEVKEFLYMLG